MTKLTVYKNRFLTVYRKRDVLTKNNLLILLIDIFMFSLFRPFYDQIENFLESLILLKS